MNHLSAKDYMINILSMKEKKRKESVIQLLNDEKSNLESSNTKEFRR